MKNLDVFSRRFLVVTLGISAVLLSGSLLLLSLNGIPAASADNGSIPDNLSALSTSLKVQKNIRPLQDDAQEEDIRAIQVFGIGIREGTLYFGILYNNNTIGLHRSMAEGEDVLDW
ncbi:MAG: hypothetical protein KFF73_00985 [Cyclobacteriaceae bacterium]|nr:hypothetical protein [Cyclobacteriaceae bacterium]